jgi:Na+-translocating ferredoxin:NAD+ oxidoreductase RnfC subunit
MKEITLRVSATWDLAVAVGDAVHPGQKISAGPKTDESPRAPVAGTVKSIAFDPGPHEFVIVLATAF